MASKLTIKQDKFVREYVKDGNGTRAAKLAGYAETSAHVRGSELVRNLKVSAEVAKLRRRNQERMDVSREKLINDAAHDAEQAALSGDYSAANASRTFIAKAQGYLVERSMHVNVDLGEAHLDALRDLTNRDVRGDTGGDTGGSTRPNRVTDVDADDD